jgi:asparagine synthase (glutamine-hydrolysing)
MCGIAGSIHSKLDLLDALNKIKHRGPDAQGTFENEFIQFGHVRLSIMDLSDSANQPFVDYKNGSVLVFNGEIYNYKELRTTLQDDFQFTTTGDTEVLFYGLQKFGIQFVNQIRGMFAFAFYDGIGKHSYLVRDRFGIKPLYIRKVGDGYIFSSEIKAIRPKNFTDELINQKRLSDFIYHRRLDHTHETFYNGIEQIPAASYFHFDHNSEISKTVTYYHSQCIGAGNNDFNPEELRAKIIETVVCHLQSDVPVGSFLSGGIDSSIIAHIMTQVTSDQLSTLSGRTIYAHAENKLIDTFLEEHLNVKSIQFTLDGSQFYNEIFNVIQYHDEPILDGSMFSHYMLCKKAKENGLKVVLSGSGGDEIFGGYEAHSIGILTDQIMDGDFFQFLKNFNEYIDFHQRNRYWVLVKIMAEITGQRFKSIFKRLYSNSNLLTVELTNDYFQTNCKSYTGSAFERSIKHQTVPPYLHYEDRNSMAFGIEIRVPFLDHTLYEYVARLKRNSIFDGKTKSILRLAFQSQLSDEIIFQRKKEGFPSPIDTALKTDERLRTFFYTNLNHTPYLNIGNCLKLADDFYLTGKNLTLYWRTLSYVIWYSINNVNE